MSASRKTMLALLVIVGVVFNVLAADRKGGLPDQLRIPNLDRGRLLVRWNDVVRDSVQVRVVRQRNTAGQEITNYAALEFRYTAMPESVVRKIHEKHDGELIEIKGRDGVSVAGRLTGISMPAKAGNKSQPVTLRLSFATKEEADIAADFLAGRLRSSPNKE